MNARVFYALVPLAALLSSGADAQSVLTQRPLELSRNQQTTVYRTIVREQAVPQARPSARKTTRQTITPSGRVVRTTTTERVVTRPVPVVARSVPVAQQRYIAPVAQQRFIAPRPVTTFVTADPLELTADQRTVVYRTLVQPAPLAGNRFGPYPRRGLITQPAEPRVISTIDPTFGERVITTMPQTTGVGTVIANDPLVQAPGGFGELAIGSRIPASVPVYVMPASLAATAPEIGGYHYALIGDRVYLIDPHDGIVVGMLYQ